MKYISFNIIILFVVIPPLAYIFTIHSCENYLEKKYQHEIEDIYIGDPKPLFEGTITLKEAINKNIDTYLQSKPEIRWGIKVILTVTTKQGTLLYPAVFTDNTVALKSFDNKQIAADNFNTMNEGLIIDTSLRIEHTNPVSNGILAFYIVSSIMILYGYYRIALKRARKENLEKINKIENLMVVEEEYRRQMMVYIKERERLKGDICEIKGRLEKEKIKASINEEEMIEEIVKLEKNVEHNLVMQKEKESEINLLKQNIKQIEESQKKHSRKNRNGTDSIQKRFRMLYRNILFNQRAIVGFLYLNEDMQMKAEQIIHHLNHNPANVSIKRKVFGKKSRLPVQEVLFSYKGRLYFHKMNDNRIEIIAIGTKNTQLKDLEFINNL